jgi:DNA-binding response OmpR family regulator
VETTRQHKLYGGSLFGGSVGQRRPLRDPATPLRSGGSLSPVALETRRAAVRALEGGFNACSMLPALPVKARCGELEVDRAERRVTLAGDDLSLTRREYALLRCLVDRANRVISAKGLLADIWELEDDYDRNLVHHYIRRLRKKFGAHAGMIETIRGVGYCLRSSRAP